MEGTRAVEAAAYVVRSVASARRRRGLDGRILDGLIARGFRHDEIGAAILLLSRLSRAADATGGRIH